MSNSKGNSKGHTQKNKDIRYYNLIIKIMQQSRGLVPPGSCKLCVTLSQTDKYNDWAEY